MNRLRKIITSKPFLISLVIVGIIIGLLIRLATPSIIPSTPILYPNHLTTYRDVKPGTTSLDTLTQQYGDLLPSTSPFVATTSNNIVYLPSPKEHLPTEVTLNPNQTVAVIKEKYTPLITHGQINDYLATQGQPDLKLYGPWSRSGFISHVWLNSGLIVIANPNISSENITEIWRIPPMSEPEFLISFGSIFATEPTYTQE